jgi:hypothetical protein
MGLDRLQGTKGDAFNKMANDAQNKLKAFEMRIRANERKKVFTELWEQGKLKDKPDELVK